MKSEWVYGHQIDVQKAREENTKNLRSSSAQSVQ